MTSPEGTDEAVADCAAAGIPRVWMYRAGGKGAVSEKAIDFCQSHGITVVPGVLIEPYGAGGNLLFLDPATGNQIRLMTIADRADGEATVSKGIIYVSRDDGNLIALGQ